MPDTPATEAMRNNPMRAIWLSFRVLLILSFWSLSISPVIAQSAPFVTPNSIDISLWNIVILPSGVGTVTNANQRVEMTRLVPGPAYQGVQGLCKVRGDFDVQVDFTLLNWPAHNFNTVRLAAMDLPMGPSGLVGVYRNSYGTTTASDENYQMRAGTGVVANVNIVDSSGKLRVKRIGSRIEGYYWNGIGFVLLASGITSTDDTRFLLDFASPADAVVPSPAGVGIAFNNFIVTSGTVLCPNASPSPAPPSPGACVPPRSIVANALNAVPLADANVVEVNQGSEATVGDVRILNNLSIWLGVDSVTSSSASTILPDLDKGLDGLAASAKLVPPCGSLPSFGNPTRCVDPGVATWKISMCKSDQVRFAVTMTALSAAATIVDLVVPNTVAKIGLTDFLAFIADVKDLPAIHEAASCLVDNRQDLFCGVRSLTKLLTDPGQLAAVVLAATKQGLSIRVDDVIEAVVGIPTQYLSTATSVMWFAFDTALFGNSFGGVSITVDGR